MIGATLPPTSGTLKDPVPLLQKRVELLEGEVQMLHGKLQKAYRDLAKVGGKDKQQALDALLEELRRSEELRLVRIRAEEAEEESDEEAETSSGQEGSEDSDSVPKGPVPKGHGPRRQARLSTIEAIHELHGEDCECEICGGTLVPLGDQFEEYEEITVFERLYVKRQVKKRKYRCNCNSCVVTAPGPVRLVPGGRYDLNFAVQVAVDKYLDHVPLERQTRVMDRLGLTVTSQTLWDQIDALAKVLAPTYECFGHRVLEAPVVHADETRWPRLESSAMSPWMVWTRCTPKIAHYAILGSKSAKAGRRLFSGYQGILVVDGYAVYETFARTGPNIRLANCWAHARRKFEDIQENYPAASRKMLAWVRELYQIEAEVKGPFPGDEQAQRLRLRLRQEKSKLTLGKIWDWACTEVGLPRSELGKAIKYMVKRWSNLTLFTENPQVPLDNNAAERSLRGPVIGRKVHYGSKPKRGTVVAATFYTLLETAKFCGVEPARYLQEAAQSALEEPGSVLLPQDLPS